MLSDPRLESTDLVKNALAQLHKCRAAAITAELVQLRFVAVPAGHHVDARHTRQHRIPAHNHPTSEYVTVISGKFHIGMGDKLDEKNGVELRAGGFGEAPTVPPGLDSAVLHRFARVLRRLCACASRFAARVEAVCRRPCCPCCQW
jgi:hypothetical protein